MKGVTCSASSALNTAAAPIATQRTGPSPGGAAPSRSSAARMAATPPDQATQAYHIRPPDNHGMRTCRTFGRNTLFYGGSI